MNDLTVIITSNFIPSHPSIYLIKSIIDSLSLINLKKNTKIILTHDGLNSIQLQDKNNIKIYKEYINKLKDHYINDKNIIIIRKKINGHLTGNIRKAMRFCDTKYILIIQHDLRFFRGFDIYKVMEDMENNPELKHIRFNKRKNIKINRDASNNLFGLELKSHNYSYTRTPCWSDNNHICLKEYYTDIILKECSNGKPMECNYFNIITNEIIHKKYGTYIYGGINHKQVIKHLNGRKIFKKIT